MFIGFLSYTNEAVLEQTRKSVDISMLDDSVLEALDINKEDAQQVENEKINATFLEQLVEEQKQKKIQNNKDLIQGYAENPNFKVIPSEKKGNDSILNESFPVHFDFRKFEDSANEKRPN